MGYVNYFTIFVIVSDIQIIGIDIAPGKNSTIYDGGRKIESKNQDELVCFLKELKESADTVILCWDAPLTGPQLTTKENYYFSEGDFTKRLIEKKYNNAPKGISVLGYASCPHWAITKFLTGYPIIGDFCKKNEDLPFQLITEEKELVVNEKYIVEVHPALSMWLMMVNHESQEKINWIYKGSHGKGNFATFKKTFFKILNSNYKIDNLNQEKIDGLDKQILNDDHLDAFVAWLMGYMWVHKIGNIMPLGNIREGCILLPKKKE